jgi:hypothetical protein
MKSMKPLLPWITSCRLAVEPANCRNPRPGRSPLSARSASSRLKKPLALFAIVAILIGASACSVAPTALPAPTAPPGPVSLVIAHTNDVSGYLEPCG